MFRARPAIPVTLTCLIALSAEAFAFGVDWPAPEPRLEPSPASERASKRAVRVTVTPRVGDPQTTFRVRFTSQSPLAAYDGRHRIYVIVMDSPETIACIGKTQRYASRGRRGTVLTVRIPARGKGGHWCATRYRGTVHYVDTQLCPAIGTCETPEGLRRLRRLVGRFAVRVR